MKGWGSYYLAGGVLAVVASALLLSVQAVDFLSCRQCHQGSIDRDMNRRYLHAPFRQQQCRACHAVGEAIAPVPESRPQQDDRRKINWFGDGSLPDTEHWFLVPAEQVKDSLVVETRRSGGEFFRWDIDVPPLAGLNEVEDTGRSAVISGLQVMEVQRGVFLSATIGWETDTLTDALVRYGKKDLEQTSSRSNRFGRRHQVVLYNLKPDRTYRFSAISTDLFGRSQASDVLTFSTSKPFAAPHPPMAGMQREIQDATGPESRFHRVGDDYLVELTAVQPSSLSIGAREFTREQSPASPDRLGEEEFHAGLNSRFVTSLRACESCHQHHAAASHPVNVYPKRGMIIPPEYPTLPDGRITCTSCHEGHGSEHPYLLRKPRQRELCIGCHRDMM